METGLPTGSIMEYIFLLTLLLLVRLTSSHYNAGRTYRMQVKGVTLKNHSNNGLAILHGSKLSPKEI